MTDISKMPLDKLLLNNKAKLVRENFFELDQVGQGFIVEEYLTKTDYKDLGMDGIMQVLAQRDIDEGFTRYDFIETASLAYSELKDDDEDNEEEESDDENV